MGLPGRRQWQPGAASEWSASGCSGPALRRTARALGSGWSGWALDHLEDDHRSERGLGALVGLPGRRQWQPGAASEWSASGCSGPALRRTARALGSGWSGWALDHLEDDHRSERGLGALVGLPGRRQWQPGAASEWSASGCSGPALRRTARALGSGWSGWALDHLEDDHRSERGLGALVGLPGRRLATRGRFRMERVRLQWPRSQTNGSSSG